MYQYRQIIVRLRSGESDRAIARAGLAGRRKITAIRKKALALGWLEKEKEVELPDEATLAQHFEYKPSPVTLSTLLPYQDQVTQWAKQGIQTTTIHATLVSNHGFTGSYFAVQRFVKKITNKLPTATIPLDFKPGECAQVDFGAGPQLVDTRTGEIRSTWIFVMVLAWSRHTYAEIVLDQRVQTWLGCHRRALEWFNGVPQKIVIDNPKCAITKACYYDPTVQRSYAEFAEGYGFIISACPPREPKKKGRVESGVKYIKKRFVPLREFRHLVDANQQLKNWLLETAGNRIHGSTYEKPLIRFIEIEQCLLKPLPNNPPELAVWAKAIVHGDCHVQFEKCRYSVPYQLIRETVWLRASETTVRIYQQQTLVALHGRLTRLGSRSTLPAHLPPNAQAYAMRDSQWCLQQAKAIGFYCTQLIEQLFASTVLDNLRAAQGIIGLGKTYGHARLETACQRALMFDSASYRTISTILKKGLDYEPLPTEIVFDELSRVYTGRGHYYRDTRTLLQ